MGSLWYSTSILDPWEALLYFLSRLCATLKVRALRFAFSIFLPAVMFHAPWEAWRGLPPYDVHAPPKKFGPYLLYFISIFDIGSQVGLTPYGLTPYDVHAPPKKCVPCVLHSTSILDPWGALRPMMSMRHLKTAAPTFCILLSFWMLDPHRSLTPP